MAEERAGDWLLGESLASGALGEVREAASPAGERAVVKRLHAHAARDPALHTLFAAECALTCSLPPHHALVRGLDSDPEDERPWLALARIDGRDLRTLIDGGAVPPADTPAGALAVRRIVAAAAGAVAYLHEFGWVHGDVVPQNLVIGPSGPVLCDLGIARRAGADGPVRGTAAYMAPEQVRGEAWTPAVDCFALGVILWELASGARLFHRGEAFLSMAAVVEEPAPPLADATLAPLAAAALAKDPAARPSAAEIARALG